MRKRTPTTEGLREIVLTVVRSASGDAAPRRQRFRYCMRDLGETVATALLELNGRAELLDTDGAKAEPIRWACSCLQKKCGACAMRINGVPALACDSFLRDLPDQILLEPLRKFPVVADLEVDRSIMQKNLLENAQWLEQPAQLEEHSAEAAYAASRCLQCGLCLEICPNFDPSGGFTGMASAVPAARAFAAQPHPEQTVLAENYRKRVFAGCGKSLACRDICPAGIEPGELLAQSNAAVVWRRRRRKGRRADF